MFSRKRSRSPLQNSTTFQNTRNWSPSHTRSDSSDKTDFDILRMQNIPKDWNHIDVKQFIQEKIKCKNLNRMVKFIRVLNDENGQSKGECLLIFSNTSECKWLFTQLDGVTYNGTLIHFMLEKEEQMKKKSANKQKTPKKPKLSANPPSEVNDQEHYETYGLSMKFLNSLNIKLPLLNKIFIANLDLKVDEEKLREVFSLAGMILNITVIDRNSERMLAKIEYDHPVEAVQAVSMFHNVLLYGKTLFVQIDQSPRPSKPAGLGPIGPGLGQDGAPLRGVRNAIELQPIKQFLIKEMGYLASKKETTDSKSNIDAFNSNISNMLPVNVFQPNHFTQTLPATVNTPNMNLFPANNLMTSLQNALNPKGIQNLQILQNLMQQGVSNDLTSALSILQSQNVGQNMMGFSQNSGYNQQEQTPRPPIINTENPKMDSGMSKYDKRSINVGDSWSKYDRNPGDIPVKPKDDYYDRKPEETNQKSMSTTDMLVFTNLPPSVTTDAFANKMREVGELKFAEITGYGRAIVRFVNVEDAARCVHLFDRSKVDGQTIEVKYF